MSCDTPPRAGLKCSETLFNMHKEDFFSGLETWTVFNKIWRADLQDIFSEGRSWVVSEIGSVGEKIAFGINDPLLGEIEAINSWFSPFKPLFILDFPLLDRYLSLPGCWKLRLPTTPHLSSHWLLFLSYLGQGKKQKHKVLLLFQLFQNLLQMSDSAEDLSGGF